MDVGILGGTFDPFHLGHLSISEAARRELSLDIVLLMPAKVSPFKVGHEMAPDADRVGMLECVVREHPEYALSRVEIDTDEISYTWNTLTKIRRLHPEYDEIWFLMGTDSFLDLESWSHGGDLLRHFAFGLAPRPGFDRESYEKKLDHYRRDYGARIKVFHNRHIDVSSTEIKQRIREGQSINGLVPEAVERYINEHGLYR